MGKAFHQNQGLTVSSATVRVDLIWPEFKKYLDGTFKKLHLQYVESPEDYQVFAIDDSIVYLCQFVKEPANYDETFTSQELIDEHDAQRADFEANFKGNANKPLDVRGPAGVRVTTLDAPKEPDNKPVVTISPATQGFVTWICGAGDDANPTPPASGRGTGTPFLLEFSAEEVPATKTLEFDFTEPVEVHDGQVSWKETSNWGAGDTFSLGLRIPATPTTPNAGGTGNCNKVEIAPGMNIIVPAAGDGAFDLDLTDASPVEDKAGQGGYWNNDYNTGAVTPNPIPGAGRWNLFDFDVTGWLIKGIRLTHPMGVFDIDVYKTEYFHPAWYLRWEVTKNTPGAGSISGWIFCFRRFVT